MIMRGIIPRDRMRRGGPLVVSDLRTPYESIMFDAKQSLTGRMCRALRCKDSYQRMGCRDVRERERERDAALFGSRFCALSVLSKRNHVSWNATNQYPVPPKFFGADSQSSSYRSRKHKFGCAGVCNVQIPQASVAICRAVGDDQVNNRRTKSER